MVQDKNSDQLEFNDGIGDMLQDKHSSHSRWWQIPLLSIAAVFILGISFFLSFNLGKTLFLPKKIQKTFVPQSTKETQFDKLAQEFTYKENVKKESQPSTKLTSAATKNIEKTNEKTTSNIVPSDKLKNLGGGEKVVADKKIPENINTSKKETSFSNANYKVIVGAFSTKENASEKAKLLLDQGFPSYIWEENKQWKVQIGSFKNKENAEALKKKAESAGHEAIIISK